MAEPTLYRTRFEPEGGHEEVELVATEMEDDDNVLIRDVNGQDHEIKRTIFEATYVPIYSTQVDLSEMTS